MELCDLLVTKNGGSPVSIFLVVAGARALVRVARGGGSPDEMLLVLRAITYLCDAMPRAADAVVRHGLLPVLCSRLLAIEYLDVAEQVLNRPALKPQSHDRIDLTCFSC